MLLLIEAGEVMAIELITSKIRKSIIRSANLVRSSLCAVGVHAVCK